MIYESQYDKLKNKHEYLSVEELPSKNRNYPDLDKVLVRDLMFDEIKALAKFISPLEDYNLKQLLVIFFDAIKLFDSDGNKIKLEDLEVVDFHYLLVVTSILTDENTTWNINTVCNGDDCNEQLTKAVPLDAIEYEADSSISLIPIPGTDKHVHPLTLKDKLNSDNSEFFKELFVKEYYEIEEDSFDELLSYAVSVTNSSNLEVVNNLALLLADRKVFDNVIEVNKLLKAIIKPIEIKCESCLYVNKMIYDFQEIRGYL
jgi:hypothetical protein